MKSEKRKSGLFTKEVIRLRRALRIAAVEAYQSEVVDTLMEDLIVGTDMEYSSGTDWINQKVEEWLSEADTTI